MPGRVVHSVDFQRVLATAPKARSAHFAVHHVADEPSRTRRRPPAVAAEKLSTATGCNRDGSVDKFRLGQWLGLVVPRRLARRAVTRQLLKRQMRAALQRHAAALPGGLWVLRLRSGFDSQRYLSAASTALRQAVRGELDALLAAAAAATRR
ncbi:ribonuclease P protein component [Azohydromonas sediminis]|uniref:ribonuclease P protein component n=1 Tax=Azohydromonas sediminis TaxID=2259674 RepID=UPI000E65A835|nr:ribonuclease P protein component [Azohydromonas sediminis]